MIKYVIRGGRTLSGEVTVSGAKNAAVALLAAAVLCDEPCVIENIPRISDVTVQLEILRRLGAKIRMLTETSVEIDARRLRSTRVMDDELARANRASYYFIGSLLGRYGSARVCMPGGCNLGVRAIDQHIKGFEALGAQLSLQNGSIIAEAPEGGLKAQHIYFDLSTVGGTINVILAAVRTPGLTILENCAKEPHIVDLANFLNAMGADIKGAGTDIIKVRGVSRLHGCTYSAIPDQIEAGTYIAACAAAGGEIVINNVIPKHLECIATKMREIGVEMEDLGDAVRIRRIGPLRRANVKTMPYPGFPTDMQPQVVVLLSMANGTSIVNESIFSSRFRYVDELGRMGAHIQVDGQLAIIEGVQTLIGAPVQSCDLRAGAAMVVAGLAASGVTEVLDVHHIERGYENFVEKLTGLGADIARVETPDTDDLDQAQ